MVKNTSLVICFIILLLPLALFSQNVRVDSEIEGKGVLGKPLKGSISITHTKQDEVDPDSFQLGTAPLEVEFLKEVRVSPDADIIISIYNFTLKTEEPGLHVLPEISVLVGGKVYKSIQSTYVIEKGSIDPSQVGATDTGSAIILRLENIIDGDTSLYPGQQAVVGYRFLYNYSVDLTQEELPLLQAEGFQKVGAKDTKEFKKDNLNTLEVRQVIQAEKPGKYSFPAGILQGRAYRLGRLNQKEYARSETRAESQPVTFHVKPFPEKGKPSSFNGAIGTDLNLSSFLLSSDQVTVGDKMTYLVKISGEGEMATIPLPEVCCQPGYSGFFRLSDLPPVEEVTDREKSFTVEMRPLTTEIKEIPILEFSYFNPKEKKYVTVKSDPIPLTVTPLKDDPAEGQKKVLFEEDKSVPEEKESLAPKPGAIEIEGNYTLTSFDLESRNLGNWGVLLIIPFGIGIVLLQIHMRNYIESQRQKVTPSQGSDIFKKAFQQELGSADFFYLLQKAFFLLLMERGEILSEQIPPDQLPDTGASAKVKELMEKIDARRFSGESGEFDEAFEREVKALFKEIKNLKENENQ